MREARDVVVALGIDEHLGLVLEPPERLGMEDGLAVALERRSQSSGGSGRARPRESAERNAAGASRSSSSVSRVSRVRRMNAGAVAGMGLEGVGGHVRWPVWGWRR